MQDEDSQDQDQEEGEDEMLESFEFNQYQQNLILDDNTEQSQIQKVMHMTEAPKKIEEVQSASIPQINDENESNDEKVSKTSNSEKDLEIDE